MTAAELLAAARKAIENGFALLADEITPDLEDAFRARGIEVATKLGISAAPGKVIDREAAKYASRRAGGLMRDFAESTPEMLRATVEQAITEGWGVGRLRDELGDNYGFAPARALNIARTETGIARRAGGRVSARALGAQSKHWDADEGACELCLAREAAGWIGIDEEYPDGEGDDLHPGCTCGEEHRMEPADDDSGEDYSGDDGGEDDGDE